MRLDFGFEETNLCKQHEGIVCSEIFLEEFHTVSL